MKPLELLKKSLTYLTPVLLATPALAKEAAAEVVKQTAEEANQPSTLYRMFASPWFIPITLPILLAIYGEKIGIFIGYLNAKLLGRFQGSFQDMLDISARAKELLRTGQAADDKEALGMAGIERFPQLQGERLAEAWEVLGRRDKARRVNEERRARAQAHGNRNTFTPGFTAGNDAAVGDTTEAQPASSHAARGPSQKKHTRRGGGHRNG